MRNKFKQSDVWNAKWYASNADPTQESATLKQTKNKTIKPERHHMVKDKPLQICKLKKKKKTNQSSIKNGSTMNNVGTHNLQQS